MTIADLNRQYARKGIQALYEAPFSELEELLKILPKETEVYSEVDNLLHIRYQWELD